MDIDALTDDDLDELASQLAGRLPTGRYGGQFVLSRRQLLTLAGGSAGVAGLTALGVDPATAQSAAGQVGTEASPEDVFAYDLDVQGALQRDLDAGGQAIENAGSVSTEGTIIDPSGQTIRSILGKTSVISENIVNTADITTSSFKQIYSLANNDNTAKLHIKGDQNGASARWFYDEIVVGEGSFTRILDASLGLNSPDSRTYQSNGLSLELQRDGDGGSAADDYEVVVFAVDIE